MQTALSELQPDADPRTLRRLADLFSREFDFVWRLLRRLGVGPGRVDDETQRVFVILARKLVELPVGVERSFLVGTAMRVAANARRSQAAAREQPCGSGVLRCADPLPSPEELLDRKRRRELLDRILSELTLQQRTVFVLSELEGMSRGDIARCLQLPRGTVASRLRLAKERFYRIVARVNAQMQGSKKRSER